MSDREDLAVSPSDPASGLVLEPPVASEKERRRQETMQFYGATTIEEFAGRFGLTGSDPVKTLKRWVAKGRGVEPADLPPFQRPHELAAWWRRMQAAGVMGKKPPEWIVLLEQAGGGPDVVPSQEGGSPAGAAAAIAGASGAVAAVTGDHTPSFALPVLDGDADGGAEQLQAFAKSWLDEMEAAQRAKDSKRFFRAYGEYKAITKELRAWQKDRQRERVANGELLDAEREKEALGIIFASMGKTFTSGLEVLAARLNPDLDVVARRELVLPFRDKIYSALKNTRFQNLVPAEQLERFLAA